MNLLTWYSGKKKPREGSLGLWRVVAPTLASCGG